MPTDPANAIARWSAAIREIEVLEPWLTESHADEHYWDDVAALTVARLGRSRGRRRALKALRGALEETFSGPPLESDNGFYRDQLDRRLDLIVRAALAPDPG